MKKFSFTNIIQWIKTFIVRLIKRQYPNKKLDNLKLNNYKKHLYTLFSSTESYYLSPSLFNNWKQINEKKLLNIKIFSHDMVNKFMLKNYKNHPIYNIFLDATIPVLKIDIFRLCFVYLYGGIWMDFKSNVNFDRLLEILKSGAYKNGLLIAEERFINIEVDNINIKKNVIHNGFFYLPQGSFFAKKLINTIVDESNLFYDISFDNPKRAILDFTGPHQYTKTFYKLPESKKPKLIKQDEINFVYMLPYSRNFSILNISYNYSKLRNKLILKSNYQKNL